jgi:hypothetical protein
MLRRENDRSVVRTAISTPRARGAVGCLRLPCSGQQKSAITKAQRNELLYRCN